MPSDFFQTILSNPLLALFGLIGLGLALGSIQIKGITLGSSGVIFTALLAGHLGCTIPAGIGSVGLALFVYCVGISAGNRFFGALKREGSQLAKLALVVVGSGALTTWALAKFFHIDAAMAAGAFAGAMTSTPALAAATEGSGAAGTDVVVGYGIAYPFGVIGVVLFVQLIPKLLKLKIEEDSAETKGDSAAAIERRLVEVRNENLFGKRLGDSSLADLGGCQVSRIWRHNRLEPVSYEDVFDAGQLVLLVGAPKAVKIATELIGRVSDRNIVLDADNERRQLVVTQKELIGKTLAEIDPLRNHGVVVTRISRLDFTFVPDMKTRLEKGDILTAVGAQDKLAAFGEAIGHHTQAFSETSLASLAIGLALGVALGKLSVPLPWGDTFSLGLAGGPLLVALLLGHFGRVGGVVGYIPRPTRVLLQEMGLVFFLADAGIKGGASMGQAIQTQGAEIFLVGALISIVPMVVGYITARKIMKLTVAQSLGGICGGMTSTPALGAIVSKTHQQAPIVSYATVYPVAVIMMALLAKFLIKLIG
ncbi:YidE/YbjL duplication [Ruficoccus amylovorans]|uniref:YidE/YbjL duplication n=1 Tax=Ruficoccus amylovorans TaxID=1804625 RepID=A0A842HKF9_9BACT|nr:TrkA C-terminal domain-containing protein [Ruficoccus amylovorans]MBC2596026.1 YidE/YbjL duplication [Ruficoccus amylovorans]